MTKIVLIASRRQERAIQIVWSRAKRTPTHPRLSSVDGEHMSQHAADPEI